jgi:hypothetical protein
VILAAGRACEEILLHDVYEFGCSGDAEIGCKLALKLADGDTDKANTLLREAEITAHALVNKYWSAIRRLAVRLLIKHELVLDLAEAEIRACIEASEPKPVVLDAELQQKLAIWRVEREIAAERPAKAAPKAAPAKGRVVHEWNFDNPKDLADWNKQMGRAPDADPIGFAPAQIVRV